MKRRMPRALTDQERLDRRDQWRARLLPSLEARWRAALAAPDPRPPTLEELACELIYSARGLQDALGAVGLTFSALKREARISVCFRVPVAAAAGEDEAA